MTEPRQSPLRVFELAQGIGGAVCGRLLAGLGHDVVKCEPAEGDFARRLVPDGAGGSQPLFAELNAGKRGVMRREPGLDEALLSRIGAADVVIVDGNPVVPALSAARLHSRFPGLVVVAVTTSGLDEEPDLGEGDSLLAEAAGGLAYMIGEPRRRPLALGGEQAAYAAGMVAFFGVMLALRRRERLGVGELVDVAMADVVAYMDWKSDVRYGQTGEVPRRSGASSGRWRMVPAKDGWVGVIFEPRQWQSLVDLVGDPRLADPRLRDDGVRHASPGLWWPAIEEWAAARPKAEIYEAAQRRGLPFGHSVTVAEIPGVAQYQTRGFVRTGGTDGAGSAVGAPFGPGRLPWSSPPAPALGQHQQDLPTLWDTPSPARDVAAGGAGDDPRPLAGVTVVDLGTITAGAATGRLLADYGATVLKVETPDRPDAFRKWIVDSEAPSDNPSAIAPMFDSNNAGKLGLALDLKTTDGLAAFKRVVERADVLVENFGIGVTERLGIDFATLRELNPRLVYVSLSSQGQDGPERTSRSYGSTLDLLSGLASVTGYDAGCPLWSSVAVNYPDQLASVFGAAMTVYCLATGRSGVHLDLSQREVVSWTLSDAIRLAGENAEAPGPTGNARPGRTPHEVYRCAGDDEWIAISCRTDVHRDALARVVPGLPRERGPARWSSDSRLVDESITRWTGDRQAGDCVAELTRAGVPCAPVSTARTRAADPRSRSRRVFLDDAGRRIKGFPMIMRGYAPPMPELAPQVGEHSDQILRSLDPATGS